MNIYVPMMMTFSRLSTSALVQTATCAMATTERAKEKLWDAVEDQKGELSTIKRSIAENEGAAINRIMKRIRLESKPTFREKSHEKRAQFNAFINEEVDSCSSALETKANQDPTVKADKLASDSYDEKILLRAVREN